MPVKLSTKALRERQGELHDKCTALVNLAEKESRDLTDDEKKQFDAWRAESDSITSTDLPRAEWFEGEEARLASSREPKPEPQTAARKHKPAGADARAAAIVIPQASQYRHGKLRAYSGQHADAKAFIAGMFFLATLGKQPKARKWCEKNGVDIRYRGSMKESGNELGGFLVPDEMEQAIIDLRESYGVFRRNAYVSPMASETKTVPRRAGGLTAYFVDEEKEITSSDKAWDKVRLVAKKLAALCLYSNELSEDAIVSMGDDLTAEIAYAFALKEDECGFIGDGTSTYGRIVGVVNAVAAGSVVTAAATHTGFETLTMSDFESCVGKLPEYAEDGAKWYISKVGWSASMLRLLDAAGGNTASVLAAGQKSREFLGYPVEVSQVLNKTLGADASKPKAILANLQKGAILGSRRGMSIQMSDQRYFETDQIGIKGTQRFDINVHDVGTASASGGIVVLNSAAA